MYKLDFINRPKDILIAGYIEKTGIGRTTAASFAIS